MKMADLEKFVSEVDSKYRAVLIAAKRSRQLQQGLKPLFEGKSKKITTMALEEFINRKVKFEIIEPSESQAGKPADPRDVVFEKSVFPETTGDGSEL